MKIRGCFYFPGFRVVHLYFPVHLFPILADNEKEKYKGRTRFLLVGGAELGIIAQVAYVSREGIKSDVIPWGLEFPWENKGSHTIYTLVTEEWFPSLYS